MYKTGDLARYLSDGNLEFLGRIDHQIKLRGFRIEIGEIESVLATHPAIRETAVLLREDKPGDKRLVAYVVLKEGAALAADELRNLARDWLPAYAVPAAFVFMKALPLTPNLKLDRQALPPPAQPMPEVEASFVPPRSELERLLVTAWQEVLQIPQIGVNDNFFDLGGHSLLMVQLHSRLSQSLPYRLSIIDLFRNPTIGALAAALARESDKGPSLSQAQMRARQQKAAVSQPRKRKKIDDKSA
jgi:aryl carrier-like protein